MDVEVRQIKLQLDKQMNKKTDRQNSQITQIKERDRMIDITIQMTDRTIDRMTDRTIDKTTERMKDGSTDTVEQYNNRQNNRNMDRKTNGQTDRQTE